MTKQPPVRPQGIAPSVSGVEPPLQSRRPPTFAVSAPMDEQGPRTSSTPVFSRKNVTRACDLCRRRKLKCDGREFCARCLQNETTCTYNALYNRVRGRYSDRHRPQSSSHLAIGAQAPQEMQQSLATQRVDHGATISDPGRAARIRDDSGDPSVHAFLQRVTSHLAQVGQGLPRSLFNPFSETVANTDVYSIRTLILPDKQVAKDCIAAYFDHGNATCRFLLPTDMYHLLDLLYDNDAAILQNHAQMAIIMLLIGAGCVWSASLRNEPVAPWRAKALPFLRTAEAQLHHLQGIFPPSLNMIQAQLLKCQCELVLGWFNSAWVSLGVVVRLAQVVDIQREQESQDPLATYHRRFLFWSIFIIDRYLAVILGRPVAIHESATDVKLSVDLDPVAQAAIGDERKLLVGTVAHAGLVRIIGNIMESLYSAPRHGVAPTEEKVARLENELHNWVNRTPKFFHFLHRRAEGFEEGFYEVPWILRRQQRTVHATFYFANMLLYRGHLLRDFLNHAPSTPQSGPIPDPIAKCVENAKLMVALAKEFGADKYNGTFWITSHFVYCAISILLVYITLYQDAEDRSATEDAIEEGMTLHRKLENIPNIQAQALLEESQQRSHIIRNIKMPMSEVASLEEGLVVQQIDLAKDLQSLLYSQLPIGTSSAQNYRHQDSPGSPENGHLSMHSARGLGVTEGFDLIMDIGFDSNLMGSYGSAGEPYF